MVFGSYEGGVKQVDLSCKLLLGRMFWIDMISVWLLVFLEEGWKYIWLVGIISMFIFVISMVVEEVLQLEENLVVVVVGELF